MKKWIIRRGAHGGSGAGYTSVMTDYLTRLAAEGGSLTTAEKGYLNTLTQNQDIGEFDRLWVHGLSDQIAARISLVNALTADLITEVNAPTFTAGQGYTGNGTTMYLNTNYNPFTDGVKFTQNSCSYGGYFTLNIDGATVEMGASDSAGSGADGIFLEVKRGGLIYANINGNFSTDAVTDARGLTGVSRDNAANFNIIKNGVLVNKIDVSQPLVNKDIYLLNWNEAVAGFLSPQRIALSYFGSGTIDQAQFYTDVQTLGTSLGWAV